MAGLLGWRNYLLRRALAGAAKIIAPTRFVADWHAQRGVLAGKMIVIPHGLPLPKSFSAVSPSIDSEQAEQRPALNLPKKSALIFAYIGGLSWQKGVHILIEAFNGVQGNATLWIAGDESADPEYVAKLKQLASGKVQFLGKLSRKTVWQTLAQVDVAVTPSLWYESFSFIVSEAFAAGVPVIASRIGALAERVGHNVNGLLVLPGDAQSLRRAMQRFVSEPNLRAQLRRGIEPVKRIEEYVAEMETLYQAVLDSAQKGSVNQ
jgi:glycosyltransferase involved in cell wall biosynthesis